MQSLLDEAVEEGAAVVAERERSVAVNLKPEKRKLVKRPVAANLKAEQRTFNSCEYQSCTKNAFERSVAANIKAEKRMLLNGQ